MGRSLLRALCAVAVVAAMSQGAAASTYKRLYSFCAQTQCADGGLLTAGLLRDPSGTLYGATNGGGVHGDKAGTIFALAPDGAGWQYQVLYAFCGQPGCADGQVPMAGLIEDAQGNLYGATADGEHGGVAFKLTHNAARTSWTESVLYSFCSVGGDGCLDGQVPNSALTYQGAASGAPYDGTSPLYGTTATGGGGAWLGGLVYALTPGSGGSWTEQVVYDFCPDSDCSTGRRPGGGLVMDGAGNLLVNALIGGDAVGAGGDGTVLELSPKHHKWSVSRAYAFCAVRKCRDGQNPSGQLLLDATGDVIGTTLLGGQKGKGTVFELSPKGRQWKEQVLYSFCSLRKCKDGWQPQSGVVMGGSGNLIGTASSGGNAANGGTVFSLDAGTLDTLYRFCREDSCSDGIQPVSGAVVDGSGNIFGTAYQGGDAGDGVIFEITP
jgi:uncharacterized repeat protein (TIGR03803 family)